MSSKGAETETETKTSSPNNTSTSFKVPADLSVKFVGNSSQIRQVSLSTSMFTSLPFDLSLQVLTSSVTNRCMSSAASVARSSVIFITTFLFLSPNRSPLLLSLCWSLSQISLLTAAPKPSPRIHNPLPPATHTRITAKTFTTTAGTQVLKGQLPRKLGSVPSTPTSRTPVSHLSITPG